MAVLHSTAPYPDTWDQMEEDEEVKIFLLDPESESDEYERVLGEFNLTLPLSRVQKIYRIQNKLLWDKYYESSRRMVEANDGVLREEMLFHGTRNNKPELIYEGDSGFDMRHSHQGLWGRGNYFAKNSSYSDSFAYKDAGLKKMFVAWVLTGISHDSPQDNSLTMPPNRDQDDPSKVRCRYDSVTGIAGGTRVYITYNNTHAYPAYLIVYQ